MNTKNENSLNCNNSQNEDKNHQYSDRNTVKVYLNLYFLSCTLHFNSTIVLIYYFR